ncbi:MAG: hypothetical protein RR620_03760 [Clostridium sp.]
MKKVSLLLISLLLFINGIVLGKPASAMEIENNIDIYDRVKSTYFSQIFLKDEKEYAVYFYKNSCPYCNMVKTDLESYAEKNNYNGIYTVNMDSFENKDGWYNMKIHHERYDIEIGELDGNGNIVYYEGESAEKYTTGDLKTDDGRVIDYRILVANDENYEGYKNNANVNIQRNKVYAADYTKRINIVDNEEFRVGAVPTVIKIKGGKIVEFYQGATKVKEFFNK